MKQQNAVEKEIGESTFYIRPFPAFASARISGDLAKVIAPILGGLAPLLNNAVDASGKEVEIMDLDIEAALPAITDALSTISGDKVERLMRELLIDNSNVSVCNDEVTDGKVKQLNMDLANEIFCLDLQDMYILCWEVIKLNFSGFFKRLGIQSGNLQKVIQTVIPKSTNGEPST